MGEHTLITESPSVLIVEDHEMVAEGMAAAIEAEPDLTVLAWVGTVADALTVASQSQPDVIVIDFHLPDMDGAAGTRELKAVAPDAVVLMITADLSPATAEAAVQSGCSGLIRKEANTATAVAAIRAVHRGQTVYSAEVLDQALARLRADPGPDTSLTHRELEVLSLLAAGTSTDEIADILTLSTHTVRNHIRNLTAKLGARSRLQALAIARDKGIV